jgi:hypothetical protein
MSPWEDHWEEMMEEEEDEDEGMKKATMSVGRQEKRISCPYWICFISSIGV